MNLARLISSPIASLRRIKRDAKPASRRLPAIGTTLCCNQFRLTVQAYLEANAPFAPVAGK